MPGPAVRRRQPRRRAALRLLARALGPASYLSSSCPSAKRVAVAACGEVPARIHFARIHKPPNLRSRAWRSSKCRCGALVLRPVLPTRQSPACSTHSPSFDEQLGKGGRRACGGFGLWCSSFDGQGVARRQAAADHPAVRAATPPGAFRSGQVRWPACQSTRCPSHRVQGANAKITA